VTSVRTICLVGALIVGLARGNALADGATATGTTTTTPPPTTGTGAGAGTESAPQPKPRPGYGLQAGGLLVFAVGILGVASGVAAGLRSSEAAQDITSAAQAGLSYDAALYSAGRTYEAISIGCWVIGGLALVAGAAMFGLGYQAAISVAPEVGPGHAGASLRWSFQ
jgi:hypothetical protein